jgi:hypothetical protein
MAVEEDIKRLVMLIKVTDRLLHWTVRVALSRADTFAIMFEFGEQLQTMSARLEQAAEEVSEIRSTDDEGWRRLEIVGLTGESLSPKERILRFLLDRVTILPPVLEWANSFLGSLAVVVPPVEAVKEFKEGLEMVVKHQHGLPAPPASILGL